MLMKNKFFMKTYLALIFRNHSISLLNKTFQESD